MGLLLSVPQNVTQNIARAKNLIHRDDAARAMQALSAALEAFAPASIVGRARVVAEVGIHECVTEFNANAVIRQLLRDVTGSDKMTIRYAPGEEAKLATVLHLLHQAITEAARKEGEAAEIALQKEKDMRFAKAEAAITGGKLPTGRAILRKLAEEYGTEFPVLSRIWKMLLEAELREDAVEYLEQALEAFPREPSVYSDLVACYMALRDYGKAETLYRTVIREFGRHPRTLVNLGKLYILWHKRDKAYTVLNDALKLDPDNEEAKELFTKVDR